MKKFKGGVATIKSKGLDPYDDYILRHLPNGRYYRVVIKTRADLRGLEEILGDCERIYIGTLKKCLLLGNYADTLGAEEYLALVKEH